MKNVYLVFTIMGTVIPYLFFGQFVLDEGANLPQFVSLLFSNPAASGFTADLLITSAVFWLMMFSEQRKGSRTGLNPFIFVGLNLAIGLSCAVPAYLYAKERYERAN